MAPQGKLGFLDLDQGINLLPLLNKNTPGICGPRQYKASAKIEMVWLLQRASRNAWFGNVDVFL